MKVFKYKFSKLIKACLIIGLILCGVAFVINLYFCITDGIASAPEPIYPILQYGVMFLVIAILTPLLISILASSYYSVGNKKLVTAFGFIKSTYNLDKVTTVSLDRKTNKLAVTFDNDSFVVIVVKEEWYNDFVQSIMDENHQIEYRIISEENTGKKSDE